MSDEQMIQDIAKEVKKFGDNMQAVKDDMQRDLEAVRKLAEETKDSLDPLVQEQVKKFTESVLQKQDAIQKQTDDIEARLGRMRLGGGGGGGDAKTVHHAMELKRTAMAVRGQLKADTVIRPEEVDVGEYKAYSEKFVGYLRQGDRSHSFDSKAMSVGSDPDGGYLVDPARSDRMMVIVYESSPMRELATVETIGSDALEYPIDEGEVDAGWVGETGSRNETPTSQVGIGRIPVHELYAKPKATQKLLEDASVDVGSWIERKGGEKLGRVEATAFIVGNGINKPRGILTYADGTVRGKIQQINGGHATQVTFDGLIKTVTELKEFYHAGAVWMMRRATEGAVMLLKDGQGQYLWRPSLDAGKPSTLLGYAVRHAADMPAVAGNALPIAFGNFAQGYTIVQRLGLTVLRDPYSAKPFVEFYMRARVGGDVTNFEAFKIMKIAA